MAEVGTYYITIMPDMSKFTGGVNKGLGNAGTEGGKQYTSSFMDVLKGSAIGTALGNLAASAGSAIMSGLSTGIGRIDTIKNFPRVMESLGYETGEADRSVRLIMDHLDGLPTATQDVVGLTQAIADSTGDLDLATRAALGFNDMMLANGASAAEVTQAQGVFNRVLGKGNATVAQWQSLQSVMPAQLAAVARELGGEGMSVEELRDKLNDGTISWNDFLRAIVKLDEGDYMSATGKKIESFADQARANSNGIGTAMANVQNRIGAGWASILEAIGREDISNTINNMSYGVRDGMQRVGDAISYVKKAIGKTDIMKNAAKVFQDIGDALKGWWTEGDSQRLKDLTDALIDLTDKVFKWLADHGDAVKTAIGGIVGALAGLAGWQIGTQLAALPGVLTAITAALAANPFVLIAIGIAAAVGALYTFFTTTETGKQMWSDFCAWMSELWTGLQEDWAYLCSVLSREWESFKVWIDGIPEWWQGVMDYWSNALAEQAENFRVSWEKIKSDFAEAWENIKTAAKEKWESIKTTAATTVENIRKTVADKWNAIKTATTDTWNAIKTTISTTVESVKTTVSEKWENIKTATSEKWNAIKTSIQNVVENIKSDVSQKWETLKDNITTTVENIKRTVSDKFHAVKDAALSIFDNIKNGIADKIQAAKDTVANIIEEIKSLFDFEWSLPAPALPHISWHWDDIGGLLDIPVFDGIDWYAKGGIFDGATVIGIGEAGREAALPLNTRSYREIARGISAEMGGTMPPIIITNNEFNVRDDDDIQRIADSLSEKILREMGAAA